MLYNQDKCPYNGPDCILINNNYKKHFACKTCGTGWVVLADSSIPPKGKLTSFNWHGKYPWEKEEK